MSQALIAALAECYATRPDWKVGRSMIENYRDQVEHWFGRIPVPVVWLYDTETDQPFKTRDAMARYVKATGTLLMLSEHSEVLGRDLYSKHRAVHDWFGHIVAGYPFGGIGEAKAFLSQARMFTPNVRAIPFSDVVLTNNYWQHYRKPWPGERWVYAPDLIPRVADAYL
jgi:hypothetical protein